MRTSYVRHCQEIRADSNKLTCMAALGNHLPTLGTIIFPCEAPRNSELKRSADYRSKNVSCSTIQPVVPSVTQVQVPRGLQTNKEFTKSKLKQAPQRKETTSNKPRPRAVGRMNTVHKWVTNTEQHLSKGNHCHVVLPN